MRAQETVDLEVLLVDVRGKAFLVEHEGARMWVPRSVCNEELSDVEGKGDEGTLVVEEWWAQARGLA